MTKNDKKLELTWYHKDKSLYYDLKKKKYLWVDKKDPRVSEPRIFLHKATYGDKDSENLLVKGDNLLALKLLRQDFQNRTKLIFLDPPYNTGNAFEQYDDGLEHSIWLGMMRVRLEELYRLPKKDGSLWITIDDNESHYLKLLCDEIFGRKNFVANVIWQKKYTRSNDARWFSDNHDHILVYAEIKRIGVWISYPEPRRWARDIRIQTTIQEVFGWLNPYMPKLVSIEASKLCDEAKKVIKSLELYDKKNFIRDIIEKVIIKERSEVEVLCHIPLPQLSLTSAHKLGHEPISRDCRFA